MTSHVHLWRIWTPLMCTVLNNHTALFYPTLHKTITPHPPPSFGTASSVSKLWRCGLVGYICNAWHWGRAKMMVHAVSYQVTLLFIVLCLMTQFCWSPTHNFPCSQYGHAPSFHVRGLPRLYPLTLMLTVSGETEFSDQPKNWATCLLEVKHL